MNARETPLLPLGASGPHCTLAVFNFYMPFSTSLCFISPLVVSLHLENTSVLYLLKKDIQGCLGA